MNTFINQNFTGINYAALPFHHLISAQSIDQKSLLPDADSSSENIECRFIEYNKAEFSKELIWEVKHFDELKGCGEIYRAEMFTLKRAIYELGNNLQETIEIKKEDLQKHLNAEVFKDLTDEFVEELFFDNLITPFKLTLNSKNQINRKNKSCSYESEVSDSYLIYGSSRVTNWIKLIGREAFQITLSSYWQDWARFARKAGFDFELLEKLSDSYAIRFYELTKLLCASQEENSEDKSFCELTIDYERFVMLMPLAKLLSVEEVENQVNKLIDSLKKIGYVKHFSLKEINEKLNSYKLIFDLAENSDL